MPDTKYDPQGEDRNCSDFDTWALAQAFYEAAGGPETDRHRLDRDGNGVACETLPGARPAERAATAPPSVKPSLKSCKEAIMKSYMTHLECTACGRTMEADQPARTCPGCGKVLYARYDLDAAKGSMTREALAHRAPDMWRYFEVLPIRDWSNVVTLGEGYTPLLRVERLRREI